MKSQPRSGSTALLWVVLLIAAVAATSMCSLPFLSGQTVSVNLVNKLFRACNVGSNAQPINQVNKVHVVCKPQLRPFWWEFRSYPFPIMDMQFSPLWSSLKALPPKPEQQCTAVKDATFEQVLHEWQAMPFSTHACMATSIQTDSCQLRQLSKAHWPVTVPGFAYATHPIPEANVTVSNSTSIRVMVEAAITKLIDNYNSQAKALQTIAATTKETVSNHMSADFTAPNAAVYAAAMAVLALSCIIHAQHMEVKQLRQQLKSANKQITMVTAQMNKLHSKPSTQPEAPVVTAELLPKEAHVQVDVAVQAGRKKPSKSKKKKAAKKQREKEKKEQGPSPPPAAAAVGGQTYGLQTEVKHTPTETPAASNNGKEVHYIWGTLAIVLNQLCKTQSAFDKMRYACKLKPSMKVKKQDGKVKELKNKNMLQDEQLKELTDKTNVQDGKSTELIAENKPQDGQLKKLTNGNRHLRTQLIGALSTVIDVQSQPRAPAAQQPMNPVSQAMEEQPQQQAAAGTAVQATPTADVKNNNHNSNNGNNADVDLAQLFKQLDDLMAQKKEQALTNKQLRGKLNNSEVARKVGLADALKVHLPADISPAECKQLSAGFGDKAAKC